MGWLGSRPGLAVERSAGALTPDSPVVDVGALCANISAGSAASRATANPDANGERLMTELGKVVWLGRREIYRAVRVGAGVTLRHDPRIGESRVRQKGRIGQ